MSRMTCIDIRSNHFMFMNEMTKLTRRPFLTKGPGTDNNGRIWGGKSKVE